MSEVVLHVATVDLGNGVCLDLEICEGDDPRDKARALARRFGLSATVADALVQHVASAIAAAAAAAARAAAAPPLKSAHESLYARAAEARERLEARRWREAEEERARRDELASTNHTGWVSAALTRDRGVGGGSPESPHRHRHYRLTSYGEMLHAEAVAAQERRARLVAEARAAREAAELAACRPWSSSSSPGASASSSFCSASALVSSWPARAAAREARLEELRRQRDEAAMAECTFAPRTNCSSSSSCQGSGKGPADAPFAVVQRLYYASAARAEARRRERVGEQSGERRPRPRRSRPTRAASATPRASPATSLRDL